MTHYIKLREDFEQPVLRGEKTFEIRENDRGYQKGDRVVFLVIDKQGSPLSSGLNEREYEITYVLSGWGLKNGYCAFGIKPVEDEG